MVATSETLFLDHTKLKRSVAVTAVEMQQPQCPLFVTKHNKVFAENADTKRHIAEFTVECNGDPEPTEILAAGRPRAYVRKFVIFNRPLCFVVSTEGDLNIIFITSRFLEVGALW